MPVNHNDFYLSAISILEIEPENRSEISLRGAGSRAYYAVYHKVKSFLSGRGVELAKLENSGSHEALIATLSKRGLKSKSFADSLARHKKFRHMCDYNLESTVSQTRLQMYLSETKRLLDLIDRLE